MAAVLRKIAALPREIEGQISTAADKNVRPITFRELAQFAFPEKTEHWLSFYTECDERTCRRWMAGSNGPPGDAVGVVMQEILRRFRMRRAD